MNNFDFIPDRAINDSSEDELNRSPFAKQLKDSLSNWENGESLVISLRGEWGEGKSSVLNLLKEQFEKDKLKNDPTIIEFNPWAYSNRNALSYHFFNDISGELKLKSEEPRDKKLAKKLKIYSQLINLDSEIKLLKEIFPNLVLLLGIIGISASKLIDWIKIKPEWIENLLFIFGLLILLSQLFSGILNKIALFFELKTISKVTTTQGLKKEIIEHLKQRNKKLLIIIDDIDRLSQKEICEVFKLIRVNADFPNTIYLLAFDNRIIEANLQEQKGISGKDYLKKIVQVDFNLPYIKNDKIQQYLFKELNKILSKLPNSINIYFKEGSNYWANTYHSGYKNFFKNIRDVKRYMNSLLFNINLLHRDGVFEVNPIDFIALEALRVFTPEFYDYLKINKDLFTDPVSSDYHRGKSNEERKKEIQAGFALILSPFEGDVKILVDHLFPQLDPIIKDIGGMHYAPEIYFDWRKELRICSKDIFDAYFTLNPNENESELTQYDLNKFLATLDNYLEVENALKTSIDNKKLRPLLRRLQDYTKDKEAISIERAENLMIALNNISDKLPNEQEGVFDLGVSMDVARIIYQLLSRENKQINFKTVKNIIEKSKGIFAILYTVSMESSAFDKNQDSPTLLFEMEDLFILQNAIISKIEDLTVGELLENENFHYIINRWKDWGTEEKLIDFINKIKQNNISFLKFLNHFISVSKSVSSGSYGTRIKKQISFKNLSRFIDLSESIMIINKMPIESKEYLEFSDLISMFKSDYERFTKNPDRYSNFDYD